MTDNQSSKWYIIQVVSNHEQKVKEDLERRDFQKIGEFNGIEQVLLPMVSHETKTGKHKRKPMFPGYLFVKVNMTDESWYIIRNTQYVTGIVGSSGQRTKPTPIPDYQIDRIIERINEESSLISKISSDGHKEIVSVDYDEGDEIFIKEGDFVNQTGKVVSVSLQKQTVTVEIEFFGRNTAIELPIFVVSKK